MWSSVQVCGAVLFIIGMAGIVGMTRAQDVDSQVRQRALEDFHGPDLEGKDGPLAKAGFDLALLYHEWRAHQEQETESNFTPSQSSISVQAGSVTIDAIAAQDPATLQRDLQALGLENAARAGRLVSGRLPIAAIPEAAQLESLRAMRPARAMTHSRSEPVPSDTTAVDDTARSSRSVFWYIAGGVALLVGGLLFFALRH